MEETDEALLTAWRTGDARAGQALFKRHFEGVARFFFSKVQSGVDDLVQRTFLALLERELPAGVGLRPYLFGIARKLLLRRFRDQYRDGRYVDELTTSVAALQDSPSALTGQREQLQMLFRALQALPVDLQIALELFYWEDLTAGEIGAVLGVPEGTVRTRLRRARQLLAEQMRSLVPGPEVPADELERWARELRDRVGR